MDGFATVYNSGKHRFICVGTVPGPRSKYILPNDKDLKSKFYSAKSSVLDKNYKKIFFNMKEELILAGNSFFSFILLWLLVSLITKEP